MAELDTPFQLSPVFKPKIWGRKDLAPVFAPGKKGKSGRRIISAPVAPSNELIGEVWITDDESKFLNGRLSGRTLRDASQKYGPELNGKNWEHERFPILAKYIFTSDWLSVQVHPDDDYARVHDAGNVGKCEMWYIVQADPGAEILLGL